ncbi:hypothetical protein NM688_g8454 [Phlebia brevispora]|uniref:Uncharacterized protein n=1 Tax=Phlebia brevispora TaxID=194682 RepID=A0ACC1RUB2_9APHY|nr:hypothetical protein NM688_g8454 [Phlebia brevispora]
MAESNELPSVPLFIDGQYRNACNAATYDVYNPATIQVIEHAASATAQDWYDGSFPRTSSFIDAIPSEDAVKAAQKAFNTWKSTTAGSKAAIFRKAAELLSLDRYRDRIVQTVIEETRTSYPWAKIANVDASAGVLLKHCDFVYSIKGEIISSDSGRDCFVQKLPMGVIFVASPWNVPLGLALISILPPIAAGNTVVLKTSEYCPASQLIVGELLKEAGLPDGVLNIIHISRDDSPVRVAEIIAHSAVRKIACTAEFTGSDRVGKLLALEAAKHLKPCVFELGGKAPSIVLNDANIENAARDIAHGAYVNSGQICTSTERVIVQREVSQKLIGTLKACATKMKAEKDPLKNRNSILGCLISPDAVKTVISAIEEAVSEGAELILGDMKVDGTCMQPHIVLGAKPGSRLWEREICTIAVVDTVDESVDLANASAYSLTSSLWTENMALAWSLASRIRAGKVIINGPTNTPESRYPQHGWGGASGYGTFTVESFLNTQLVSFRK